MWTKRSTNVISRYRIREVTKRSKRVPRMKSMKTRVKRICRHHQLEVHNERLIRRSKRCLSILTSFRRSAIWSVCTFLSKWRTSTFQIKIRWLRCLRKRRISNSYQMWHRLRSWKDLNNYKKQLKNQHRGSRLTRARWQVRGHRCQNLPNHRNLPKREQGRKEVRS